MACNQPHRPTQSSILPGMGNDYQPKCGVTMWLGSKGRYGSFHLQITHVGGR